MWSLSELCSGVLVSCWEANFFQIKSKRLEFQFTGTERDPSLSRPLQTQGVKMKWIWCMIQNYSFLWYPTTTFCTKIHKDLTCYVNWCSWVWPICDVVNIGSKLSNSKSWFERIVSNSSTEKSLLDGHTIKRTLSIKRIKILPLFCKVGNFIITWTLTGRYS